MLPSINKSSKSNYLIIGQGIAGTMLAWNLLHLKQNVIIADVFRKDSSSQVAAGIYLPITGRRIAKSWLADRLIPFAEKAYRNLEHETGQSFLHPLPIVEIFDSQKTYNDWQERAASADIKTYVEKILPKNFTDQLVCEFGGVQLHSGGYLNMPVFLKAMRNFFSVKSILREEHFNITTKLSFPFTSGHLKIDKIIFCDGISGSRNPYFQDLPFQFSKGEIITIHCEKLNEAFIYNHGIFILPVGNHHFRVGSTYEWNFTSATPTMQAQQKLISQVRKIIKNEFSITGHHAAIRPTVKERRPFIGMHPVHKQIGILNGLGTKGVMLAPYFANHFAEHLVFGNPLMPDVDISRFY
jgi:glycine/D-amino acid oxidase-like deaminating enzyme